MNRISKRLAILFASALLPSGAPAQDAAGVLADAFARLDRNGDGRIDRAEFPGSDQQFATLGPGEDRAVTAAEFADSELARRLIAARARDASNPRPREDADARLGLRIAAAMRLDSNRDGKLVRAEWTGDDTTFAELDLDADGDVDRSDAAEARRRAPAQDPSDVLPEFKRALEPVDRLLERLDRDRDGALSATETRGHRIAPAFGWADRNRDGRLDAAELERLAAEIARRVRARDRGDARPTAYRIPFASWDKNGDGRIETGEWQGPKYLFPRIDQDRDAALSQREVERYARAVEGDTFLERFDLNDDGGVTLEEFGGPPGAFRRADRNGDGVVTRADR